MARQNHPLIQAGAGVIVVALIAPWLNPVAFGPNPAVQPWLFSASCAVLCWFYAASLGARVVSMAWLIAALLSSVIGLIQFFGATGGLDPWIHATAVGEAFANLRQRNQFATLTNIGLAALIWFASALLSRVPKASRDRAAKCDGRTISLLWLPALFVASSALLAAGNAASSSRTGLAQLVLVGLMAWMWGQARNPRVRLVLLVVGIAYFVAAFALPRLIGLDPASHGIAARLQDGGPACSSRLTLWSNVLHLIAQKPWTGWGWGELDYAHFITLYTGARFCDILDNAHNLPLHLAVELGLPFASLVCGAAGWLVIRAKPWRETDATRQMAWAILALIMLHSMLEYPLWYGPFQMTFAICIWLLWRKPRLLSSSLPHTPSPEVQPSRAITSTLITGFAFALLAFTAYAAWDYHRISQIYLAPEMRSEAYRDNTLAKAGASWLFRDQVRFAELTTTDLTSENAREINALAKEVQHFSPESRVVIKIIESAALLGRNDEAQFYLQRFKAAYPQEHERWAKGTASEDAE